MKKPLADLTARYSETHALDRAAKELAERTGVGLCEAYGRVVSGKEPELPGVASLSPEA